MSGPLLSITVYGTPVGQGAISHNRRGRGYHSNGAKLLPWRARVAAAAMEAAGTHRHIPPITPGSRPSGPCQVCKLRKARHGRFDGALWIEIEILLPPVASAPGRRWPTTRSSYDWDHLARAVCDALGEASIWNDDSQIVSGLLSKRYAGLNDPQERPGALVRVWRADS
ncbi:RusA family crossover junction endodeoxyribonuclease [Nonomuraea soli]|uniref:Uncharacterized protein n=1 Tax=Nonomuraea soli TaxID=1032476 RepID=A0A7W0HW14_9ACTN|nr:RusA family crossover junction endodeoxyribonuclease [Nonomuraea soli]MBA2897371.1 hypothetical protein [Nonomuraea soli]